MNLSEHPEAVSTQALETANQHTDRNESLSHLRCLLWVIQARNDCRRHTSPMRISSIPVRIHQPSTGRFLVAGMSSLHPITSLKGFVIHYSEVIASVSTTSPISLFKAMGHSGLLTPCHVTALRSWSDCNRASLPGALRKSHVHHKPGSIPRETVTLP